MREISTLRAAAMLALAAAFAVPVAASAFADGRWQHQGGWGGGHERHDWGRGGDGGGYRGGDGGGYRGGDGGGMGLGGVLLGLGVGAAVGAAVAAPRGGYYAAPPPVYYGY